MPISPQLDDRALGYLVTAADWNALVDILNNLPVSSDGRKLQTTVVGEHTLGVAAAVGYAVSIGGVYAPASAIDNKVIGVNIAHNLGVVAGASGLGVSIRPTLTKAASGTHGLLVGTFFGASIGAAAGGVSEAATVYILGAPTGDVPTANYALHVADGVVRFESGVMMPGLPIVAGATGTLYNDGGAVKVSP